MDIIIISSAQNILNVSWKSVTHLRDYKKYSRSCEAIEASTSGLLLP